jgi:predicted secreted protein
MAQLTTAFSTDARRTDNERIEAQLRQVLIAGILQSSENTPIQLPNELRNSEMKFTIQGKTITAWANRHRLQIELPSN